MILVADLSGILLEDRPDIEILGRSSTKFALTISPSTISPSITRRG
jgi:hypothetical protein